MDIEYVTLGTNEYEVERTETEIILRRFDKKTKMQVHLCFPVDGEDNTQEFIDTLIKLYIDRKLRFIK